MNERIRQLANQAGLQPFEDCGPKYVAKMEKFAELIVQEHINVLKQEWYELNNAEVPADETLRDVGMRIGRKGEIIVLIEKIKKRFGVNQ
jgi:hypothetical protein